MNLEIITPEKKLFSGEIEMVQLPGTKGSFEILINHAPIISTLEEGIIRVRDKEKKILTFEIQGGVIEAKENSIIVLAEVE
ncbi:MAG: ATP synthase F1 subunit epsilon [Bacteroidales bacterium]|nr:ATP synthase F1 subunit epsilon [Bacteroidales bacterium]MCF8391461.1 ATP synthase F1 subunit epsilon [Bacteroidales bacterium]